MIPPVVADHCRLLLEPWCLTPAEIARLTRWQVVELYLRPQAQLVAGMKGDGPAAPLPTDRLPTRAEFVAGMTAEWGGSAEKWAADYDRMMAEILANGGT